MRKRSSDRQGPSLCALPLALPPSQPLSQPPPLSNRCSEVHVLSSKLFSLLFSPEVYAKAFGQRYDLLSYEELKR